MIFKHVRKVDPNPVYKHRFYDSNNWFCGNYKIVQYNHCNTRDFKKMWSSYAAYIKPDAAKSWGSSLYKKGDQVIMYESLEEAKQACIRHQSEHS